MHEALPEAISQEYMARVYESGNHYAMICAYVLYLAY